MYAINVHSPTSNTVLPIADSPAIRIAGDHLVGARCSLARLFARDFSEAIRDFDQALRLTPNDADAYHGRGWSYAQKGNYQRAFQDYSEALRIKPADLRAVADRRLAYLRNGDYLLAMADEGCLLCLNFAKAAGMIVVVFLVVLIVLALRSLRSRRIAVVGQEH